MRLPLPALALVLATLASSGAAQERPAEPAASLPAITVSRVEPASLTARVRVSGLVEPVERVLVQPLIEGQAIEAIEAEVGDWVEEGAVLARLSDAALVLQRSQLDATRASAEAAIAQAEAQVAEAEAVRDEALRDRDRAVRLEEQGATSSAAADTARSAALTAAARVNAAVQSLNAARAQVSLVDAQIADVELQLRRTAVRAPVAGRISAREATIGAIASMGGAPLFEIFRDGALELYADVSEQDVLALAPGQPAEIRVLNLGAPIGGAVRLVEPTVDDATRLGRVRISVDEPDRVRAGMFAEATVETRSARALAAPMSAVAGAGTEARVLRVRDGVVENTPVTTGIRDGGLVEIAEGLAAGDLVVTRAGAFVRDGDRIKPVPAQADVAAN